MHESSPYDRRVRPPQFRPGYVFWLERGSTWLNADKARPFVLATASAVGMPGTLVYGSTQETEARFGVVGAPVEARLRGVSRNGLERRTVFYPGVLVRERYERLPVHAGSMGASMAGLRATLRIALGIGTGSCLDGDGPPGLRGRIVRLEYGLARALRTHFAVILTSTRYSAARRYQLVLPILPDDGARIAPAVLRLSSGDWMRVFAREVTSVLAPIPLVHSIWHRRDVENETPYVLDKASLEQIDRRLCEYFSLVPPGVDG